MMPYCLRAEREAADIGNGSLKQARDPRMTADLTERDGGLLALAGGTQDRTNEDRICQGCVGY